MWYRITVQYSTVQYLLFLDNPLMTVSHFLAVISDEVRFNSTLITFCVLKFQGNMMISTSPLELIAIPLLLVFLSILPLLPILKWLATVFSSSISTSHQPPELTLSPPSTSSSHLSGTQVQSSVEVEDRSHKPKQDINRISSECEDGHLLNHLSFWYHVKLSKITIGILMGLLITLRCFELGWNIVNPHGDELSQTGRITEDVLVILFWSISCYVVFHHAVPATEVAAHWSTMIHLSIITVAYTAWSLCCLFLPNSDLNRPDTGSSSTHCWLSFIDAIISLGISAITCTVPRGPQILYRSPYEATVSSNESSGPDSSSSQSNGHENAEDVDPSAVRDQKNRIKDQGNVTLIASASIYSYLFFNWVSPVIKHGMEKPNLDKADLPHLTANLRSWNLYKTIVDSIARASQDQTGVMKFVGKSPNWMNPLLWRVIKINQAAFVARESAFKSCLIENIYDLPLY